MDDVSEEAREYRARRERDTDLLIGIRRNDVRALRQFVQRFEPILLDQGRRLGVRGSERRTVVIGFLDDILVKLARTPAPRSLASFVITSFRNCITDMHREASTRERHALAEEMAGNEGVIRAGCSEFMLRSAAGADTIDEVPSSRPDAALVRILLDSCTPQERQLLVWSAHRVPLRDCAVWLGISYDSAKQRLSRLRARLIHETVMHLSALPVCDRANIIQRLQSAGVKINNEPTRGSAA